jgi:5-methylcytosine-specific restriction endonuclease McrA
MFATEHDPLALLVEITPKLAKKRFREEIYKSWNHCCGYCGEPATSLDHIVPRFKSGSSNRNNLLPSCQRCNSNKGSLSMIEWYSKQKFFSQEKLNKIQEWIEKEVIDLFQYTSNYINKKIGA